MSLEKKVQTLIHGTNILVTGGTGSIGSEIVRKLLTYDPKVVRIISNSENELFELQSQLKCDPLKVRFLVGDIRDKDRLLKAMKGIDFVFHAAALKHVPLCEYNPLEAVLTNVIGTNNVIEAAINSGVKKVINISTDKAVNPVNTMGACKLLGEKITSSTSRFTLNTILYSVRFGNVLGSRGSILPIIKEKILNSEPIPITDENMSRFVMTISDAVSLVIETMLFAKGGEIFVLKMNKVRIKDLIETAAEYFCQKYRKKSCDINIENIGKRPGEKLSEALLTAEELEFSYETEDLIIVPPDPSQNNIYNKYEPSNELKATPISLKNYSSDSGPFLTKVQIMDLLQRVLKEC